jgi:hypothetical protein
MHLLFADSASGVRRASQILSADPDSELVALTTEALDHAHANGIPCRAVSEVASGGLAILGNQRDALRAWIGAMRDFEETLAAEMPRCAFEGPGILLSRGYLVSFAVNSVRCRAGLMMGAVSTLRPGAVTVLESVRDAGYRADGYELNPWTIAFQTWAELSGLKTGIVSMDSMPPPPSAKQRFVGWVRAHALLGGLKRALDAAREPRAATAGLPALDGARLLFSDYSAYDWSPVRHALEARGATTFVIERAAEARRSEDATYRAVLAGGERGPIALAEPQDDARAENERAAIGSAFDRWAARTRWRQELTFSGVDTFAALRVYIRSLATSGPSLLRRADALAASALDAATPQVVCFPVISYPYQKRLAHACRRRRIPVVCYQHGGAYGSHDVPVHDFSEAAEADHFLVYGAGIAPAADPLLPRRAQFHGIGSARPQVLRAKHRRRAPRAARRLRVVFAGDVSLRNTVTAGTEIEDTARYALETRALSLLAASRQLDLVYRPFPADLPAQGTPDWLARHFRQIPTASRIRTPDLLERTDLLVTLSTSGTLWNEALALGVPLLAYVDPAYTPLSASYRESLAGAALVCASPAEFLEVIGRVAAEGGAYAGLAPKDSARFLRDYVLTDDDCVASAVKLLATIRVHAS